jgi:hypothetical protein
VQVDIEQANLLALFGECQRQTDGHGAFADAALAGHDKDPLVDFAKAIFQPLAGLKRLVILLWVLGFC